MMNITAQNTKIPETITLGKKKITWSACNDYQKAIYVLISKQIELTPKKEANSIAYFKSMGIIEFLYAAFRKYNEVENLPLTIYDNLV